MTTLETLEQRQRAIRFSELPKTFKDAIMLTRSLNVQYLWIDSLCIIQDSEQDWAREAATMGTVYRNCLVCIAADGATDSNGGLFMEGFPHRNLDIACLRCPKAATGSRSAIHIRDRSVLMTGHAFAHTRRTREHYESKLDTRGWVFQEQALAPRTLHFTVAELAWDCATCIQCECTVPPREISHQSQLQACKRMVQYPAGPSSDHSESELPTRWANFVELATQRSLTYESDRLHALSGIAAVISRPERGQFLAGLWKA